MPRSYFEARVLRANTQKKEIHGEIPYNSISADLGGFFEILKPGVFSKTLQDGARVYSLWQHEAASPLGHTENGTLVLTDTPNALKVRIKPPNTSWGKDALESISRGDVTGFSFGFLVGAGGDRWEKDNLREVHSAELTEVSPVTFPAYSASVAVARSSIPSKERPSNSKSKVTVYDDGLIVFEVDDRLDWSKGVFKTW
jgi:hypothetical protein